MAQTGPGNTARYRARLIAVNGITQADARAWDALAAAQHPAGNAFLTSSFARAAAKAWTGVKACLIEDQSGLAAVLPFQSATCFAALLGGAERMGEELNDSFGVIARADFRTSPQELLALAGCNHISFSHLAEDQLRFGLSGEMPRKGLRIALPDGGDAYWTALVAEDKKFTADSDRRLRKAEGEFGAMRFVLQEQDRSRLLEDLLAHKRAQYARTGATDVLAAPGRMALLRQLAQTDAEDCRGFLSTLYFGETWAAMHFGLKSRQTLHYWFPVYNPALNSHAPGRLLLREIIRQAQGEGISVIDRGEGESAAKRDFPSQTRLYYQGAWHRPNAASLLYRAQQSLRWRLAALRAR